MMFWGLKNWNRTTYMENYSHFYLDTLLPVMREAGINIDENFMDTSPSNGLLSSTPYKKRWGADFNNNNNNFGDGHYYYLTLDCEDPDTYPQFRFLSETGFQSEPSYIDYEQVALESDLGQNTQFLKMRTSFNQPHEVMINQSRRHYHIPKDVKDREHFSYYTWLTQIQQGQCMKTCFET